jgi:hypothetical protein
MTRYDSNILRTINDVLTEHKLGTLDDLSKGRIEVDVGIAQMGGVNAVYLVIHNKNFEKLVPVEVWYQKKGHTRRSGHATKKADYLAIEVTNLQNMYYVRFLYDTYPP